MGPQLVGGVAGLDYPFTPVHGCHTLHDTSTSTTTSGRSNRGYVIQILLARKGITPVERRGRQRRQDPRRKGHHAARDPLGCEERAAGAVPRRPVRHVGVRGDRLNVPSHFVAGEQGKGAQRQRGEVHGATAALEEGRGDALSKARAGAPSMACRFEARSPWTDRSSPRKMYCFRATNRAN